MLRLLPRTRQKYWTLAGVLLISLPAVLLLFNFCFDLHSADYRQWAYIHSPLYRHYLWHQSDEADRVKQHNAVVARIQAAGGWMALQRECDALVKTNQNDAFMWDKWTDRANPLPPAIAALQPMEVMYYSPRALIGSNVKTEFSIVRINIISGHPNTGGRATPLFGLEVVCGTNGDGYTPNSIVGVYGGNCHNYEKMTNGIYEIY